MKINEINASDFVLAYKLLKDIGTKWTDYDAYKLGIIDEDGKKIKSPESSEEKDSYSSYMRIVFNLKRLLQKVVGKSNIVQRVATTFLLKENVSTRTIAIVLRELDIKDYGYTLDESYVEALIDSIINKD